MARLPRIRESSLRANSSHCSGSKLACICHMQLNRPHARATAPLLIRAPFRSEETTTLPPLIYHHHQLFDSSVMSTNQNQRVQSRRGGSTAPRIPRNMFQGANGVVISGGSFSSSLGSTTVVNNYILEPQYSGGQSPNHAYGYTNSSNFFMQGGGGSTYTTYYTSRPNSYTVITSPGIASATHTCDQMYSGTPPGNFVNLHNSTHTTTVSNGSVISITSIGSSAAVQQGHSSIYMSSTNGFQFTPSTSSLREVPMSQDQDKTTWQHEQGGPSNFIQCISSIHI